MIQKSITYSCVRQLAQITARPIPLGLLCVCRSCKPQVACLFRTPSVSGGRDTRYSA